MDSELIAKLLTPGRKSQAPQSKGYAILRGKPGKHPLTSEIMLGIGHFDSKQGSTRRSRKGRTSRAPNGYARYVPYGPTEVIAYKV